MASEVLSNLVRGINNFISDTPKGNRHFTFSPASSSTTAEAIRTSSESASVAKNPSAPSTPISQTRVTSSPSPTLKTQSPSSSSPLSSPASAYPGPFTPRGSLVAYVSKLFAPKTQTSPSQTTALSPSSIYPGSFTPRASLVDYAKTLLPTPKNSSLSVETQRQSMIYTGLAGLPSGPYTSYKSPVHGPATGLYASYDPNKDYITDSSQPSSSDVLSMEDDASDDLPSSPVHSTGGAAPLSEASSTIEFQQLDLSQDEGPFSTYDPSAQSPVHPRRSTILTSTVLSPKDYPLASPTRNAFLSGYASLMRTKPPALDTQRPSMSTQAGGMNSGPFASYVSPKGGMNSGPHGRWHHFSPNATPKSK